MRDGQLRLEINYYMLLVVSLKLVGGTSVLPGQNDVVRSSIVQSGALLMAYRVKGV